MKINSASDILSSSTSGNVRRKQIYTEVQNFTLMLPWDKHEFY